MKTINKVLKNNENLDFKKIVHKTGMKKKEARTELEKLKKEGRVREDVVGGKRFYSLIKAGKHNNYEYYIRMGFGILLLLGILLYYLT